MSLALVLTAEKAAECGYSGVGPFALGGAFPGEYIVDRPLEVRFLGFDNDDDVRDAYDAAFAGVDVKPLEFVEVEAGEGLPVRENHGVSQLEVVEELAEEMLAEAASIRSHADADAIADELGIAFPEGAKLDEKKQAIASFRAGNAGGHVAGDPDAIIPALGAEETTPGGAPEVEASA